MKLCSYEGHNVSICIFTGWFKLILLRRKLYPFFVALPVANAWNCHSLYTAFSSNVGAWGMWACSLFLSFSHLMVYFPPQDKWLLVLLLLADHIDRAFLIRICMSNHRKYFKSLLLSVKHRVMVICPHYILFVFLYLFFVFCYFLFVKCAKSRVIIRTVTQITRPRIT